MEYLRNGDHHALEGVVADQPRTIRFLVGRLWDTDADMRDTAARALGAVAVHHPEQARDLARRLIWALADEAAMNGVYGLAAIGEMGARAPEVVGDFVGPMTSHLWDEGLRSEILKALRRMAETHPAIVDSVRHMLEDERDTMTCEERDQVDEILCMGNAGGMNEN